MGIRCLSLNHFIDQIFTQSFQNDETIITFSQASMNIFYKYMHN